MSRCPCARVSYGIDLPGVYDPGWRESPKWLEAENPAEAGTELIQQLLSHTQVAVIWDVKRYRLVRYEEEVMDGVLAIGLLPVYDIDDDELRMASEVLGLRPEAFPVPGWVLSARPVW